MRAEETGEKTTKRYLVGLLHTHWRRYSLLCLRWLMSLVVTSLRCEWDLLSGARVAQLPALSSLSVGRIDSNVLIFERVREELRGGESARTLAAEFFEGIRHAIADARNNVGLMSFLFFFRTPALAGFAATLVIGPIGAVLNAGASPWDHIDTPVRLNERLLWA